MEDGAPTQSFVEKLTGGARLTTYGSCSASYFLSYLALVNTIHYVY